MKAVEAEPDTPEERSRADTIERIKAASRFSLKERVVAEILPNKYEVGIITKKDPTGFLHIQLEFWKGTRGPGLYDPRNVEKIH